MSRAMEEIKYRLCDELSEYADKRRWTERDIEMIDKITHSIKCLMKYLEMEENGFEEDRSYVRSGRSMNRGRYYRDDYNYDDRYYDNGNSMNRGYAKDNDAHRMIEELEEMINGASEGETKEAMKKTLAHLKKINK